MSTDLTRLSAVDLAARIRDGDVSATEAVDAHLERIDDRDDELNAFVTVLEDEAREAARAADRALARGDDVGPLHGVPVGLKDVGATKAGVRHTYGSAAFADNVADRTAAVVERLEAAGAIPIGTTNAPEFAHKGTTDNPLVGPTASPVDPTLNAGGSSGGSAAAVGAGMATVATGSDAAGSLRIPAAACGVFAIKPTPGLVPDDGRPSDFGRTAHHSTKGPIARTVADAALALEVMAGPHPRDPASVPVELDYRGAVERAIAGEGGDGDIDDGGARAVEDLRIAYSPDLEVFPVESDVRAVVEDALGALEAAGATVERASVDHDRSMAELSEAVVATFTTWVVGETVAAEARHGIDLREHADSLSESLRTVLAVGERYDAADLARTRPVRSSVYDAVEDVLAEYDLLATPTLAWTGVELSETLGADGWRWPLTWPFNWTGHPAASAPAGTTDEGHPVGLQLIGRRFEDDVVLAASAALERERPWDHPLELDDSG